MKKVIKNPKKMKNAMYIVFGVFALALFVITRTGNSYATDGLMIDNALDSIVLYGEVEQLPEDEEVEEVQDEEAQEIEQNQEIEEEEDIVEPEETSDEDINEEEKTSEDLDETILERDSKEIDKSENKEEPQDKEENHGVSDENGDNEENKQGQKVEEEVVCKNKEGNVESSEEFGFKTPENKITEEIQLDIIESEEIYGTGEYDGVKVEVYAVTGLFESGTILTIEPVIEGKLQQVREVLSGEVEMLEEEEKQTVVAFDITFKDPVTQEEIQPKNGTVQVTFNYEENENLVQAEENEEQEVKVYHLNDIDEEGNKIEELTGTTIEEVVVNEEESEENKIVVEAEKFSIYIVGNIGVKGVYQGDTVIVTYDANGGEFNNGNYLDEIHYFYQNPEEGTKYSHTPNISDSGVQNGNYANSLNTNEVISISGAAYLSVTITYGGESCCDYVAMWEGSHPNYTAYDNYSVSVTGKLGGTKNTEKYTINGDTVTFGFRSDGSVNGYGYYAIIEGIGAYKTNEIIERPTREGYGFVGRAEEGSTELFDFLQGLPKDNVLYAVWKEDPKIKYNANGGYFKSGDSVVDEIDVKYSLQENGEYKTLINIQFPNRISENISQQSGWMFAGWYTTEGLASTQTNEWTGYVTDSTENNMIVYAKWLPFNELKIGNGDSGMTIMDRNLGASEAGTGENSYGYYYQRGNNYGFPNDYNYNSSMYSSDMVDASGYGPSNYYSNSLFRRTSASWDSSNNGNLWGGEGDTLANIGIGTDEDRQGPCPEGYHIPSILERDAIYEVWNKASTKSSDYDSVGKNFAKDLKLPFVGWRRNYFGNPENRNTNGYYWTSSPLGDDKAYMINVNNDISPYGSYGRSYGISLRCFKNVTEKSKVSFYKESGEKISEIYLKGWEPIENKYLPLVSDREGYEFIGWFESGRNEEFDYFQFKTGDVDLYEKWINSEGIVSGDAKLVMGKNFNTIIKTLAKGDTAKYVEEDSLIKGFEKSLVLPQGGNKKLISSEDSETPIFAWYDEESQKIKYYTKAENVYMNEDSSYMFYYLKNLSSIDLDEFKTDYVRNMDWMFAYVGSYSSVEGLTLDFRNLNLSNVTSMANMFNSFFYQGSGANNVTINFSKMNLSNVKNVDNMFYYGFAYIKDASGVKIDFSETDLSGVKNMYQMFFDFFYSYNAGFNINGVIVDFSKSNLSNVENMSQMFDYGFYDAKNISGIRIDFSEADMSNVKNMNQMFYDFCYGGSSYQLNLSGVVIDFSNTDLSSLENMSQMFEYSFGWAKKVDGLIINFNGANLNSVTNMFQMFYYFCYGYVPNPEIGGSFSGVTVDFSNSNLSKVENMVQMFQYAFAYAEKVDGVTIDFSNTDLSNVKYMVQMFYYFCYGYNNGEGAIISGIDIKLPGNSMKKVENMQEMFSWIFSYSKSLDRISIKFVHGENDDFYGDVIIDFSKLDLSSVQNMYKMFGYAFYQTNVDGLKVDFRETDMSNVTNMKEMFYDFGYGCSRDVSYSGVVIDFSKTNLSKVETMNNMFQYALAYARNVSGVKVDFSEANLGNITGMNAMFDAFVYGNDTVSINGVTVDFSKANLSNLKTMSGIFRANFSYAKNISGITIDFSKTDLGSVTSMAGMFSDFIYGSRTDYIGGVTINFSESDLSKVESMQRMFYLALSYAKSLNGIKIDFKGADLSSVTNMKEMFYDFTYGVNSFSGLTIDFSKSDLSKIEDMSSMFVLFANASNGSSGLDSIVINWEDVEMTSSLKNMSNMFNQCGVEELDLSSFDTSNVENMSNMFSSVNNLKTIYVGSRFRTSNVTSSSNMFSYAPKLVGGRGTKYSDSNPRDKTYARVDSLGAPGYFTKKGDETIATLLPGQQFNAKIKTIAKGSNATYGDIDTYIKRIKAGTRDEMLMEYLEKGTLEKVSTTDSEKPVYAWYSDNDKTIYYYSEANIIDMNTESSKMFYNLTKLEEVELDGIETHGVKNMGSMFEGCSSLTGLDLSNFDASSVTNMQNMFNGCSGIKSINLSNANMSRVTNISGIFGGCSSLEIVDFSNADMRSLTSFASIFPVLPKLREVNFHKVNLSSLESTSGMFGGISSLKYADFSDANLKSAQSVVSMFGGSGLTGADFSNANLRSVQSSSSMFGGIGTLLTANFENTNMMNVTDMSSMFGGCNNLNRVIFSGANIGNVTSVYSMFGGDSKLETVDFTKVNLSKLENMSQMFGGCSGLTGMDFSKMDLSRVTNMNGLFSAALKLESVNFGDNDFKSVTNMRSLFQNCTSLEELDITKFDTSNVTNMSEMFKGAAKLKTIYVGDEFKTDSVTNSSDMFSGAVSIVGGNGTLYDENHIDKEYARVDKSGTPGYFTLGEFSIIYNLEGGDMEDMKTSYKLGESFEIGQPTKEENVFLGWTGSNGNVLQKEIEIEEGTKGDLEFTANWKVNQYKIIFDTDGGNAINPIDVDYNSLLTGINLPTPTKECNEFSGWNVELPERMPAHDITLKAVWNYTCSKSSGGGGGGGGGSSTVKTKDDKDDHGVADEEKNINLEKEENKSIETQDNQVVENQINQEITQKVDNNSKKDVDTETVVDNTATSNNSSYTSEQKQSYEFAKSNGITTTSSIEQAKMNTSLTRIEMAKMLSYYAINVLGQEPDAEKGVVKFSDVTNKLDKEYDNGVTLAYQLGIMGQNMPNNKFRPNDEVTRAEFATALSRLLYNTDEGEYKGTRKYYEPHIAKLYNEGIINNTDSKMKEKRGYVMIMLMRTAK